MICTSVTYDLTIHHNLPLPGFLRSRVIKGLVDSTLDRPQAAPRDLRVPVTSTAAGTLQSIFGLAPM